VQDVWDGVMATRIAAHAADIAKGVNRAMEWDRTMSQMRRERNWEGQFATCIDRERAEGFRATRPTSDNDDVCSMCGTFCVFKVTDDAG
jgi:phosphomethylpyrimidine synthase